MADPVKTYTGNKTNRGNAADRARAAKAAELTRRGSSPENAAKHAGNMVAKDNC